MMTMRVCTAACVAAYIAAITTANLLVVTFGPAISVVNAFLLIGLDLSLRDWLHEAWQSNRALKMAALICTAGGLSYLLNPAAGRIAVASAVAFIVAASVDWAVYHAMRRHRWWRRANASNIAGAGVDSLLFPALAFGFPMLWAVVLGQFVAKVAGGALWAAAISWARSMRAAAHG